MGTKISKEESIRLLNLIAQEEEKRKELSQKLINEVKNNPDFKLLIERIIRKELNRIGLLRFIREIVKREIKNQKL